MAIGKEVKGLGMSWEDLYGYAQAVKVDETLAAAGPVRKEAHGARSGEHDSSDTASGANHATDRDQVHRQAAVEDSRTLILACASSREF